jgi:hypothetical protein
MSITSLITVAEADNFNKTSEDWLDIEYLDKENYIKNATVHIYSQWDCIGYD